MPYHVDMERWERMFAYENLFEYAHYVGNSTDLFAKHVEVGVMRWRTPAEPQSWYPVLPTPAWAPRFVVDLEHDLLFWRPEFADLLYEVDSPWVTDYIVKGYFSRQHYRDNATYRISKWRQYNDPLRFRNEVMEEEQRGYVRVAHLLQANGQHYRDLWSRGLVRTRPQNERRSTWGYSLVVHPQLLPHVQLWQRWQDVLVRPGQRERFLAAYNRLLQGTTKVQPWPERAKR